MPPSADDLPGRKPPRKQRRAAERAEKKKRGKQPGSAGAAMTWEARTGPRITTRREVRVRPDLADAEDRASRGRSAGGDPGRAGAAGAARPARGEVRLRPGPSGGPAGGRAGSALSIGPQLRALAVYLVVFQHVPVERCRQLIADATGAAVSDGFIHSCLRKAAGLAADVVRLIRTLITAAPVAGFDETTLRSGPAGQKKYVHGAFTEQHSRSCSAPAAWNRCATSAYCRRSPASWSPTGT